VACDLSQFGPDRCRYADVRRRLLFSAPGGLPYTLKSLKPAASHYDLWDATVPGLGVRVSQTGRKTFVLMARIRRGGHPTRRALGVYGAITLADARTKAQEWLKLIRQGIDPRYRRRAPTGR
jgi:hypothetical protein